MPSIADLGLKNEQGGEAVDLANLPRVGGFAAILQPGRYTFKLASADKLGNSFENVNLQNGELAGQVRISAVFGQDCPLTIVRAPEAAKDRIGDPFQTRVSNVERPRGKDKIKVSDMAYLLRALGHDKPLKNGANLDWAKALLQYAGKEFDATIEVQAYCNAAKDIYADDGQGGSQIVEGTKGCGARYYQRDLEGLKENGVYPERFTCSGNNGACGASLRINNQFGAIG